MIILGRGKIFGQILQTLRCQENILYKFSGLIQSSNYSIRRRHEDFMGEKPPVPYYGHFPRSKLRREEDDISQEKLAEAIIEKVNNEIKNEPKSRLFAVVHVAGKQFKVTTEDIILIQGYWAPDVGDKIRLEKVLLAGGSSYTLVGRPLLPKDLVKIEGTVIEKTLSYTQLHFTLRKRKNYRRLKLDKTACTMVRINAIDVIGLVDEFKEVEGLRPNTVL